MSFVVGFVKLENRAEKLFVPDFIRSLDYSDREEGFFHFLALIGYLVVLRHFFELLVEVVNEIFSSKRSHSSLSVHGISEFDLRKAFDKLGFELVV